MNALALGAFSMGMGASLGSWLDTHPLLGLAIAIIAAVVYLTGQVLT